MKEKLEKTYGSALKGIFHAVNPLKKKFLKTYCTVHKFISIQALEILKNDGYEEEYNFFKNYICYINDGVSWADQDFKSSNHFYHFSKGRGLFGFSNALIECKKYYNRSLEYMNSGNVEKAMFYFGASCHLLQDATVPQHVNNKLLKSHRKFELWIISKLLNDFSFMEIKGVVRYKNLEDYIANNAFFANNTYLNSVSILDKEERYNIVASKILKEAQRTTAGFMIDYYRNMKSKLN
ncbi:zinc dependent phospholipase C family protein [Clostridium rectalis]|uniref:zinc dependent phospholipase C family protein n=1 Tax=Clostridium rectalis TaxID=2040295 RepID=UPI000F631D4A|nr:zinc dependent phospholipase C family protein [Clostridium rectalis]